MEATYRQMTHLHQMVHEGRKKHHTEPESQDVLVRVTRSPSKGEHNIYCCSSSHEIKPKLHANVNALSSSCPTHKHLKHLLLEKPEPSLQRCQVISHYSINSGTATTQPFPAGHHLELHFFPQNPTM